MKNHHIIASLGVIWLLLSASFLVAACTTTDIWRQDCQLIYVSPRGNDGWPGTIARPLRTLDGARNAVRELKHTGRFDRSVCVLLREGSYFLDRTFVLGAKDSGEAGKTISYRAYPGEQVVISGGQRFTDKWREYDDTTYVIVQIGQTLSFFLVAHLPTF